MPSSLHKLIRVTREVTRRLGVELEPLVLEKTSVLVFNVMEQQSRQFHNLNHVYAFLPKADAVTAIAAIFHDLIYVSVDRAFPEEAAAYVEREVSFDGLGATVRSNAEGLDELLTVFGFAKGAPLPTSAGQNEFLSALMLERTIGSYLDRSDRIAAYACIEATIPFRKNPTVALAERLASLGFDEQAVTDMVVRALKFANQDVWDFQQSDTAEFLTNTWRLLPEMNPSLRFKEHFDLVSYRKALAGMEAFFGFLTPSAIYQSYAGFPSETELAAMFERVRVNLAAGRTYLQAKLLAMAILEAVALETGGNAPISLFMGDFRTHDEPTERLEDHLPKLKGSLGPKGIVYTLLEVGRKGPSSFDLQNSPLGLYLYRTIDPRDWNAYVDRAKEFFQQKTSPRQYLSTWDRSVALAVLQACLVVAETRRGPIEALVRSLQES